jgi:hypothetical protein
MVVAVLKMESLGSSIVEDVLPTRAPSESFFGFEDLRLLFKEVTE